MKVQGYPRFGRNDNVMEETHSIIERSLISLKQYIIQNRFTPEKSLNSILDRFLDDNSRIHPFQFSKDDPEDLGDGNSSSADISALCRSDYPITIKGIKYEAHKPFARFEAKRLDSKVLSGDRKEEYVLGSLSKKRSKNSGGIERFKNETHGTEVFFGGMIGYLQTNDPDYWLMEINCSIERQIQKPSDSGLEAKWSQSDKLVADFIHHSLFVPAILLKFRSLHSRKTKPPISFRHFWIDLRTKI